ncbi:MAG: hypothetical protein ABIS51_02860 [Sphingomonas sp.]
MTIGTLAALAKLPDMPSEPSLRRFVAARSDFPVERHGRNGVAYAFDLEAAAAFVRAHWRDGRLLDPDCEALRQLPLILELRND